MLFSWKEAAAPSSTISFAIKVLSEVTFSSDPAADAVGAPLSLPTSMEDFPVSFPTVCAVAGRQRWAPAAWCCASRAEDSCPSPH